MELLWNIATTSPPANSNYFWAEDDSDLPGDLQLEDLCLEDPELEDLEQEAMELEFMKLEEMELEAMENWTAETTDPWLEETRQLFDHDGSDEALYERVVQAIYVLCDRIRREDLIDQPRS
ncbi:MAG: hypothetical protein Fur0046_38640 [Cyanobacteria bacterium J069]